MRFPALLAACLLPAAAGAQAPQDSLPELDHYRWGFTIETAEPASFYTVPLPLDVYRSASDPDLRDLGVYNAAGQAVPRIVEAGSAEFELQDTRHRLPFAALYRNQVPDADRVRMMFEQMGDETRIELSSDSADGKIRAPLSGYIVDARGLDGNIDALELAWPDHVSGFVGRISVTGSNDLQDWRLLGGAALADLREADTIITQDRVSLADDDYDFLRIEWRDLPDNWSLEGLTAIQVSTMPRIERDTLTLEPTGRDETDGGQLFDARAALRVDRLRLVLPEDNSVLTAALSYRPPGRDRWVQLHQGTFYNLVRSDLPVSSEAASVSPVRAAEWKVAITKGRPDTPFRLELGWRPDVLLFLAQGDAPFTLAVGRGGAAAEGFPEERLLGDVSLGGIATDNGPVAAASLGQRVRLPGIERKPPPEPTDWRTILLWAGLGAAVLFVLWMALRLQRGVRTEDPPVD